MGNRQLHFTNLGDYLELCHTPFIKFVGNMCSFIGFVIVLILVVASRSKATPSTNELLLCIWTIALIAQEVREVFQTPWKIYLHSVWNSMDFVTLSILLVVLLLRIVVFLDDANHTTQTSQLLVTANLMLAIASVLCIVRFLNVLETHHLLGPLQVKLCCRQIKADGL